MKLLDLNPILKPRRLEMDCPACEKTHRLVIRFGPGLWRVTGESVAEMTIQPSYRSLKCTAHFTITEGRVEAA